MFNLGPNL